MRTSTRQRPAGRLDRLQAAARASGLTLTHQRLEILRALAATEEHPDAEAVFRAARRRLPTVSLDTVYRTLWRLHDLGLVTTLRPRREGLRFDPNPDPHHHYVCVRCGSVRDFTSEALDGLQVPDVAVRLGSVVGAHLEVRGRCAACQRSRGKRPRPWTSGSRSSSKPSRTPVPTIPPRSTP